jgi:hypothetical protein
MTMTLVAITVAAAAAVVVLVVAAAVVVAAVDGEKILLSRASTVAVRGGLEWFFVCVVLSPVGDK